MSTTEPSQSIADYEAAETLVISEPEQMRALAHDLRSRIVDMLRDRAWSTQELSRELEIPKGTVGHHLKVLERAGLIHVVRTRRVRAVTEKHYGRVAHLFLFKTDDPSDASMLGAGALRRAAEQVERAPEWTDFGFVRARLTPADTKRFERRFGRLVADFRAADAPEGRLTGLAAALWPMERDA